jgi:cellulose synthase/poly-beta-1,6-N-acetylglucosamine synthase-like glycosyltransferase
VIRHPASWIDPAYRQGRNIPPTLEAVGVVVPAHNQADTVAQCILSIFAANSHTGWRNSLWIVVVADACRDRTAKIARAAVGAFGEVLEVAVQSRGTARQIGAGAVLEHFYHKPRHAVLLANADADTCVPREWIDIMRGRHGSFCG